MIRLAILMVMVALPSRAEEIVADLSQDRISISTSFDGSEILVYGAVRREAPVPEDSDLAVIVTVAGPREDVTVRRKERRFGIWVNADAAEIRRAPSFYAVASSAPLGRALAPAEDLRYRITTPRALGGPGMARMVAGDQDFLEALIRVNTAAGVYGRAERGVVVRGETLFSTTIELPSNLTEGNYDTRIFLTRDGKVVDSYYTRIFVQKVGLERWIYVLAHEQPLAYGILSLVIAIAAGWGASALFRWIRI